MHAYSYAPERWNRYRRIEVRPFHAALGADVACGDLRNLDIATIAEIRQAWLDHLVLRFSGQTLSDEELLAVGARFGALEDIHRPQPQDTPGQHQSIKALTVISNVVENGQHIGALGDGDLVWHTDMSYTAAPPDCSLLYALEVPSAGGETGFSNMYLALETLPADIRAQVQTLRIKHDSTHNSAGRLRHGFDLPTDVSVSPGMSHPIVRSHPETGWNALYLGRRPYSWIESMSVPESEALLDFLWDHAAKPEFAWYQKWQVGQIMMWDNRCCMHRRNAFAPSERRVMHRTQIRGTAPVTHGDARVSAAHPRAALHA